MSKRFHSVAAFACVCTAIGLSLPAPSTVSFAIGGDACEHDGRKDVGCPDVGSEDCGNTYKACDTGTAPHTTICTDPASGGDGANCKPADAGNPDHDNCGESNNATTNDDCADPNP